ncbi:MAG: DUF4865 family protein, partial [Alphaproteobacteria bacterium]|nr:DUF4865 family protein [Alphaproteobacteria bacterium]
MYAMQYEITLPADYDMGIIRQRVATKGSLFDAIPGLGLKAFLIRERGVAGAEANQYAPFYLWRDVAGMSRFLWGGGGFGGIVESFGRPAVEHWTGVAFATGPAVAATPLGASRVVEPIPAAADLAALAGREHSALAERARLEGVHSAAVAIDPRHWQIVRFTLWEKPNPALAGTRYEVLHLSRPHLGDLVKAA